jgi:leader peptidase (prepilin peptidase)/N-methyltransferase
VFIAILAASGVVVGELLRRRLGGGGYRLDDEIGVLRPGAGWLLPLVVAALWGLLGGRLLDVLRPSALPAYLLVAVIGVACAWVDLDVHRIPDGLVLPGAVMLAALLVIASAESGQWHRLATALATAAATYLALFVLAMVPWGGPGYGDVKLAALLAGALGWVDPWLPLVAFVAGIVLSGVVVSVLVVARRRTLAASVAFGPGLVAGALLALWASGALAVSS